MELVRSILVIFFSCLVFSGQAFGSTNEKAKENMIDVYMIPGMGTDYRVFRDFNLAFGNIRYIEWEDPGDVRTLEEYASLLADQIDTSRNYVIVGVSFGGMLGVEISRRLNNSNLVLISSAKTKNELPNKYKTARVIPLHLMLGDHQLQNASNQKFFYKDIIDAADRLLYKEMLLECGAVFLKRQMDMIVNWKNEEYFPGIVHIHGTADHVLPARYIENAIFIEGGTHKMVINHPKKICEIIDNYLIEIQSDDPLKVTGQGL